MSTRKETQEVKSLRRALAEVYLSERAARKKELAAVKAKEAALRDLQRTLGDRLARLEVKLDLLTKVVPKPVESDPELKKAAKDADDRLKELEWKIEWLDYPEKKKRNVYLHT